MPRIYERKFDHGEAARLYKEGLRYAEIAERLGVTQAAIRRVCDPDVRRRMDAASTAWTMSGVCVDCGKTGVSRNRERPRCTDCSNIAKATSVRDNALQCQTCREWKSDEDFPFNRVEHARRGRHSSCRHCITALRRDYRNRNKVPCARCGKPRLAPNEIGSERRGLPDSGLCFACWHETRPVLTHCGRGHEFTPENTYFGKRGRECRACRRLRYNARKLTKVAA